MNGLSDFYSQFKIFVLDKVQSVNKKRQYSCILISKLSQIKTEITFLLKFFFNSIYAKKLA